MNSLLLAYSSFPRKIHLIKKKKLIKKNFGDNNDTTNNTDISFFNENKIIYKLKISMQ